MSAERQIDLQPPDWPELTRIVSFKMCLDPAPGWETESLVV